MLKNAAHSYFRSFLLFITFTTLFINNSYSQVYNNLPVSFPDFSIDVNNHPNHGYYFMSGAYFGNPTRSYTMILDTTGMPVYFQKQNSRAVGFTKQNNGLLSLYSGTLYSPSAKFIVLDSAYNEVYSCTSVNGYQTDPHELIILEDNSYWIIGLDLRVVDMSQIVTGGNSQASVTGSVIQHISESGTLLFEWNSWDYIEITDCDSLFVDLTSQTIDFVHANALSLDYDGNILMSSRHLNEITKINTTTGEIIWRMGGKKNQFTFVPSSECFYGQHTIRYCEETNSYILFDNGNWHNPPVSIGVEYTIDEDNMVATRINEFTHNPPVFSSAQGGVQRLANQYIITNWSGNDDNIVFTEKDNSNNTIFEISCPDTAYTCYRVLKHSWETTLFDINTEKLEFINIAVGDSVSKEVEIINNQYYPLAINGWHTTNEAFRLQTELPVIIEPNQSLSFHIIFKPEEAINHKSLFSFFHASDTSRIAQKLEITGSTITGLSDINYTNNELIIYPNPAKSSVNITLSDFAIIDCIQIFDTKGIFVYNSTNCNKNEVAINLDRFNQGLYFVKVSCGNDCYVEKLVVE